MEQKNKLYFIGCKNNKDYKNSANHILLFTTEKPSSLYEALREFERFKVADRENLKIVKIIEGPENPILR